MNMRNKEGTDLKLRYKLLWILLGIIGGLALAAILDGYWRRQAEKKGYIWIEGWKR